MEEPNTTDDMKATIKMGYSYCVLANLLETLYFALPDIENALVQALRKHHPKDIHFDKIMEHLGKVLDQLRMEVDIASPDPTHPKARWLTDLVEQLEEPVADIFMLKMSKISPDRYITLILDNAYDTWIGLSKSPDEQDSPSYLQFISNSVLSSRIISVAVCVGGGKKRAFHQHKHRWIYTPFLRKSQMQMSAIKMLNILIHNEATPSHNDSYASRLQAILNPNFFILPYVKQIYNDTRYNKFKAIPHKSPIR